MRKLLLLALTALLPTAALPQTRPLPEGTVKDGAVSFGTVLPNFAKREGNKTIITPDTLQILGTGSSGDISSMSVGGTALSTAMGQKAPLASPVFTGTPTAPALNLTGTGLTGSISGASLTPNAGAAAGTAAKVIADLPAYNKAGTFTTDQTLQDATFNIQRTNTVSRFVIGDSGGTTQFARGNSTAAAHGQVGPGLVRSFFGYDFNGKVGSITTNFGPTVTWRNILDDGSGNSSVAGRQTAEALTLTGTGSQGDISPMSVKALGSLVSRSNEARFSRIFDPMDEGAVCDGTSRPLSTKYATLAAAQADYASATALTNEIDSAAIRRSIDRAIAAGGGVVQLPYGTCRMSVTARIFGSGVTLRGHGPTATKLQAEAGLLKVVQVGDGDTTTPPVGGTPAGMAVDVFVSDLTITRVVGTIPDNSIGISWEYFNYGGEKNTNVINQFILRLVGKTSNADTSIHYSADRTFGYNAKRDYWSIQRAADVFISNSEWGRNKVETVDPYACFELGGTAQQIRVVNSLCIPRGPTSNAADLIVANGWNDPNGIVEFISFYTENVRYCFNALSGAGNGDFSDFKFIGGRLSCVGGTFNVPADRQFFSVTLNGFVNTNGPTVLPKVSVGGRITGSFVKALTVTGGGGDWNVTGNTVLDSLTTTGTFGNLTMASNQVRGGPASFTDGATGIRSYRGNQVGNAPLPDVTATASGSSIIETTLTAVTTNQNVARLLVGTGTDQTGANGWNTLNVPPNTADRIRLVITGKDATTTNNRVTYTYEGLEVNRNGTGNISITAGTTPTTTSAGTVGGAPSITTDTTNQGVNITVFPPTGAPGQWIWTARASITRS